LSLSRLAYAPGFEVRENGVGDPIAVGGVMLPAINLATWLWALRKLEPYTTTRVTERDMPGPLSDHLINGVP